MNQQASITVGAELADPSVINHPPTVDDTRFDKAQHRAKAARVNQSKPRPPAFFLARSDSYGDYGTDKAEYDLTLSI
jgi:hypothetical protein